MTNYSGSKCPYCGQSNFEIVEDTPTGSLTKLSFIRCSNFNCRSLICTMPFFSSTIMLEKVDKDIERIKGHLGIV